MATTAPVVIMAGFSRTNRILLYVSLLTGPAAFYSGIETNFPIGAGFLGYTVYQQYLIFVAARSKQLHALCLLPTYLNTLYAITYVTGVTGANYIVSTLMCIGTIAALIINLATTWIGYLTNIPEGYGVYRFFFFGWRTLTPQWRKLFLLWAVFDIFITIRYILVSIYVAIIIPSPEVQEKVEELKDNPDWRLKVDTALIWGSFAYLVIFCPIIAWTELIVQKNHIVSDTDMVSVYLFIAQILLLAIPSIYNIVKSCFDL